MTHARYPVSADTIQLTASGIAVDLRWPTPEQVRVEDIAAQLAKINRWNGATCRPISVAEHSLLVVDIMERDMGITDPSALLAGLLHDGGEYLSGDVTRPIKLLIAPVYAAIEIPAQRTVNVALGVRTAAHTYAQHIKVADDRAMATEYRDLMPKHELFDQAIAHIKPVSWVNLNNQTDFDWQDWAAAFEARHADIVFALQLRQQQLGASTDHDLVQH